MLNDAATRSARRGKTRTLGSIMKPTPKQRISFDDGGLTILEVAHRPNKLHEARWVDVSKVTAGFLSVMYGDIVHVELQLRDGRRFRVDQEMEGWSEFAKALPLHLSGCQPYPGWEMRLAFWPGRQERGEDQIVIFGDAT